MSSSRGSERGEAWHRAARQRAGSPSRQRRLLSSPAALKPLSAVLFLAALAAAPLQAAESWFLMSRHGECARIDSLARRIPDLGAVADPQSFVETMRRKGYTATVVEHALPKGSAFEVRVPERELSLLFVTADVCASSGAR
jgi:hypothetical protein